ncbi:autotransporter outer membrane beta-barrel domain-containing protein [Fusobacterium varium]|uniref:Autotransporter outer membrane beta-barrel domain-containing protein n=7 Tax=Fusobacterium varium TaxID=856 RepID=A0ABN5JEW2_FUSVA|nr:autotransporter outer membrane beta-barrel domain-containing protein [Fusobacterium varium]AVQ30510.1 autotransporter outer membrane beta-barrel domain-containing protein [Fusobacterium varium ATCC 27725]EES64053.1 outer membrane autotransporter barrel domain protein [Fusobacterium varium ATCC 27725]VEH40903.1 P.94 [Fusobacterium varium]
MGKKTKIILGILAIFMIVGNIGYGESLTEEKEEIYIDKIDNNVESDGDINMSGEIGVKVENGKEEIIKGNNITITGDNGNGVHTISQQKESPSTIIIEGKGKVTITGQEVGVNIVKSEGNISGENIELIGKEMNGVSLGDGAEITINGTESLDISAGWSGLYFSNSKGDISSKVINIVGGSNGAYFENSTEKTSIQGEDITIIGKKYDGIYLDGSGSLDLKGVNTRIEGKINGIQLWNNGNSSKITIESDMISLSGETQDGILVEEEGSIVEIVGKNTFISGYQNGIMALARGEVIINSDEVSIRSNSNQSNQGNAIYTVDEGSVEITANNTNIYSEYIGIHAQTGEIIINSSGKNEIKGEENGVYASAMTYTDSMNTEIGDIKISGKLNQISGKEGVTVVGGKIEINSTEKTVILGEEYGVRSNSPGGKIDITSLNTLIKAQAENGVGIKASTGADLNIDSTNTIIFGKKYSIYAESTQKPSDATLSEITLSENGSHEIYGNIKSHGNTSIKIGGKGNKISSSSDNEPLKVTATKGGKIDISLVDGILTGIVDDGRAADANANGGTINLNLDNGTWKTQGKSFVTSIDLRNNGNIIFTEEGTSVDIENLSGDGNGTFGMTVNAINKSEGNMLYVQESNGGIYNVALQNSNLEDIKIGERIRFATIGNNAKTNNLGFKVLDIKERGIRDINFKVEKEEFDENDSENEIYNGGQTSSDKKPGNGYVVDNYQDGENWYLTRNSSGNINDIGTAIMEAAKSNYANAVYMDNLNKRLGDMSFADGESGLWVRMRNDKVGEDNHYKLHNYMTQIGYDKSYSMENGIEHRGIAFEYGKGDMKYKELKGNTDTDKYILTLYKTKVRDNKVYTDYTLRGGAISNDFTVYGRETGAKVTGKYKNMVLGAGTEVGKRYELDKNWYIEPQAQLQYTYINSTDYTTNQMTKVDLDEIHSLIGRAGIKLGHDSYKGNKKDNTVYVKADINHEFLGEQNVKAKDETGRLDKTYKNNETWVEIGIGASKKITPDLNVYADVEKQLGSNKDNKNWQVNVGFRYKF